MGRKAHACTGKSHENTLDTDIKVGTTKKTQRKEKGREEWSRPGEALGSGNFVPSLLCVFSLVLADGSAFVVGFFPYH